MHAPEESRQPDGHGPEPDRAPAAPTEPASPAAPATAESDSAVQRAVVAQAALIAASKFLGRLAQLEFTALGAAVDAWHHMMGDATDDWFAAERAVARAIDVARRGAEQELLLAHITQIFRRAAWFKPGQPGGRVGATEASGQYVATLAMLALLVRDQIAPTELAILYTPWVSVIPIEALDPE